MLKSFCISAFLFASFAAKSQGYVSPEFGLTSNKPLQASLQAGYEHKNALVEGDLRFICNRHDPAYFGARAGYEISIGRYSLTPLAGAYYRLTSTDKTNLNGYVPGFGLRLSLPAEVTFQLSYIDHTMFAGIGFKPRFNND